MELAVRSYAPEVAEHVHDHHQLVLPLSGTLEIHAGSRSARVTPEHGMLVVEGLRHGFAARRSHRFLILDLPHAGAAAFGVERWIDAAVREPRLALDPAAGIFARAVGAQLAVRPALARDPSLVGALLATLATPARPAAAPGRLARALDFIDARACEGIDVLDVAIEAGVSVGHLHALFRRELGTTPQAAIAERRLRTAEALLAGDTSIAEIALRTGFSDQSSLTRALRRRHGVTPAALRAQLRSRRT